MARLRTLVARCRAFLRSADLDRDFAQELDAHLDMLADDHVGRGMAPDEARRQALLRMGGRASLQEQHRSARGLPGLDSVLQDLRFAVRLLARERWFSAAAIGALALGIGVNATGFTIVNAAFLRGLPFPDANRLLVLSWQTRSGARATVSSPELEDWRARSHTFQAIGAFTDDALTIGDDRALPQRARGARITGNTFGIIGVGPILGRDFAPADERPGADPVAIIGNEIWNARYGADPGVVGRPVRVNGRLATIVGVMPAGMKFPFNTEVWTPFVPTATEESRTTRPLLVFGRLNDGASRRTAQAELDGIARQMAADYPDASLSLVGARVETFTERFVGGQARVMFLALMGVVSLVLLIACANVANLLLSRSAHRAREVAVRLALGATRARVVRQLMVENLVLGFVGGGLGLLLAIGGVRLFAAAVQDPGMPYWIVFTPDYVVFGYVATICVVTAGLFGLAPAVQVSSARNAALLKEGGRGGVGSRCARWFSSGIVVAEISLALVVLVGAGLMLRSFLKLYTLDVGFPTDHLMAMPIDLVQAKYADAEARRDFFERLEPQLTAIPGVDAVALTTGVPPDDGGERRLEVDGRQDSQHRFVSIVTISPAFFDVIRVRLLTGRGFDASDGTPGSETVIVNERLASMEFGGADPIGRRIRFVEREPQPGRPEPGWRTIVGVAPSIRHGSARDAFFGPVVYLPYRQEVPGTPSLLVRSNLAPAAVLNGVRRDVQAIDRDQPVDTIRTLDQLLADSRWPYRVFGVMLGGFAAIALLLSSVGLYAVMAYAVSQQEQEIGVRMALGAQVRQVSWLILRRGLIQLAAGLGLGLTAALALSVVLQRMLVEMSPTDPVTYAAVIFVLAGVSVAACLAPARRAARIDPMIALRSD